MLRTPRSVGGRVLSGRLRLTAPRTVRRHSARDASVSTEAHLLSGAISPRAIQRPAGAEGRLSPTSPSPPVRLQRTRTVLGTALGERHVKVLNRDSPTMVVFAQRRLRAARATDELLGLLRSLRKLDLRGLTLPDRTRPGRLLLDAGPKTLRARVERAPDARQPSMPMGRLSAAATLRCIRPAKSPMPSRVLRKAESHCETFPTSGHRANAAARLLACSPGFPENDSASLPSGAAKRLLLTSGLEIRRIARRKS